MKTQGGEIGRKLRVGSCGTDTASDYSNTELSDDAANKSEGRKFYQCHCDRKYPSRYQLEIHEEFQCPLASRSRNHPYDVKDNSSDDETYVKKVWGNHLAYICGCNKWFLTKEALRKHQSSGVAAEDDEWAVVETSDEEGLPSYVCDCKDKLATKQLLQEHKWKGKCKAYTKREERYGVRRDAFGRSVHFCCNCSKAFCGKMQLLKHKASRKCKGSTDAASVECGQCTESFSDRRSLRDHRKKMHVSQFTCDHCSKSFSNITSLRNHKNLVHKDGVTKFVCEYCAKRFLGPSALQKHIRKHTNERPFECCLCRKKFVVEKSLKSHMDLVHLGGEKNFMCEVCGQAFARKEYLVQHGHVHSKGCRFHCEHCGASFRWNSAKRKHTFRKHLDKISLFKCKYCDKQFKLEKNCSAHMLQHSQSLHESNVVQTTN